MLRSLIPRVLSLLMIVPHLGNMALLGYTGDGPTSQLEDIILYIDFGIMGLFVLDTLLRLAVYGRHEFWHSSWNQ
jgi:hypothetical protein